MLRTALGQERALELTPARNAPEIGTRLQETDEARLFLDNGGALEFGPGADLREYVQRAMLGGTLRGGELHETQQLAAAASFNRKALAHRDDLPLLAGLAGNIPDLGGLEDAIRRAISPAGEILDDASAELRQLRRESRSAYQQLNEVMQRSLRRYQQRAVVQEPIIHPAQRAAGPCSSRPKTSPRSRASSTTFPTAGPPFHRTPAGHRDGQPLAGDAAGRGTGGRAGVAGPGRPGGRRRG